MPENRRHDETTTCVICGQALRETDDTVHERISDCSPLAAPDAATDGYCAQCGGVGCRDCRGEEE